MIEQEPTEKRTDFLDRKVDGLVKVFSLVERDWKNFILTISILSNVYLVHSLIKTHSEMSDRIIEEVRKQSPQVIKEELAPTKMALDTVVSTIKRNLNINEDGQN